MEELLKQVKHLLKEANIRFAAEEDKVDFNIKELEALENEASYLYDIKILIEKVLLNRHSGNN